MPVFLLLAVIRTLLLLGVGAHLLDRNMSACFTPYWAIGNFGACLSIKSVSVQRNERVCYQVRELVSRAIPIVDKYLHACFLWHSIAAFLRPVGAGKGTQLLCKFSGLWVVQFGASGGEVPVGADFESQECVDHAEASAKSKKSIN
eukprot:5399898-Amphidinium_carterae.1